jgi:hypothetical protein
MKINQCHSLKNEDRFLISYTQIEFDVLIELYDKIFSNTMRNPDRGDPATYTLYSVQLTSEQLKLVQQTLKPLNT